jgi:hypothetical protein
VIVAHAGGPGTLPYAPARRVSFSELLGSEHVLRADGGAYPSKSLVGCNRPSSMHLLIACVRFFTLSLR